jgi:hypothetical protein
MILATNTLRTALGLALLAAAAPLAAQICNPNIRETTPTSRFVVDTNQGTVLDKQTGLMWKRCVEGQSGVDCATGAYSTHDWGGALSLAAGSTHAGYQDWRLPNIKELVSLVEEKCDDPAINLTVFPNAPSDWHSSSSSDAHSSVNVWGVDFVYGSINNGNRLNSHAVRLVRGGQ